MRKLFALLLAAAALFAFGCLGANLPPTPKALVGVGDKDANACIGSAGYTWCAGLQKCIRPWEGNCTTAMPGSDRDSHGCIPSAGYSWCEELQKCIRPWEENCTAQLVGGDKDSHGCIGSAGYQWCPEKSKCLRVWEEGCPSLSASALEEQAKTYCASGTTVFICGEYIHVVSSMPGAGSKFYTLGNYDAISCPLVAPDSMSEQCRLLILGSNCVEREVCTAPPEVSGLKDDPSFAGVQLTWKAEMTGATFMVFRKAAGEGSFREIAAVNALAYSDTNTAEGGEYDYYVVSTDRGVQSAPSNTVAVTILSTKTQPSPGQIN